MALIANIFLQQQQSIPLQFLKTNADGSEAAKEIEGKSREPRAYNFSMNYVRGAHVLSIITTSRERFRKTEFQIWHIYTRPVYTRNIDAAATFYSE